MRRLFAIGLASLALGCAPTISSTSNPAVGEGGIPYTLPKGLVPVKVFADEQGVGITIEPATTAIDSEPGTLVARLNPNPFNNENIKVASDPTTGFLSTISNESDAQILAIAEEAAKSAARLMFQNGQAAFLSKKVVVLEDSFDPLSREDVARINRGISHAIRHAARAFQAAGGGRTPVEPLTLRVTMPDGSDPFPPLGAPGAAKPISTEQCRIGVCVRTMTSRMIRLELDGAAFGGKLVNVPARDLVAVPVPSVLFADQDISVTIKNGVLQANDLRRDSEALGVVKVPGAILNGIVAGTLQAITDEKSILDKKTDLAKSQEALAKAESSRDSVMLQNATAGGATAADAYAAQTLTIYPYSNSLAAAVKARMKAAAAEAETPVTPPSGGADLVD